MQERVNQRGPVEEGKLADSVPEAAANLGVSVRKGWQLIADGRLESFWIDGRRLVSRRAQREFVDELEAQGSMPGRQASRCHRAVHPVLGRHSTAQLQAAVDQVYERFSDRLAGLERPEVIAEPNALGRRGASLSWPLNGELSAEMRASIEDLVFELAREMDA